MLTLIVFPSAMGLKSPSPFSMKAIALMQMSGLAYKIKAGDSRKAPKKKLPVLIDGDKTIPDSTHIQAYLESEKGVDFDSWMSLEQLAIAQSFRCLCEDHLYWVGVYVRWVENADFTKSEFFGSLPALMRSFVFNMVQKQVLVSLQGQGMGRHTPDEIHTFGATDIKAISDYLGNKDFFFGDKPGSIDAVIFAALINNLVPKIARLPEGSVKSHANLVAYCERFIKRFDIPQV
ncbi:MAG: glutathione S-transferase family protein [Devosiaceae bacterium]|nr:glutathione S-transferase family protein [Devosiaceae bacterium]